VRIPLLDALMLRILHCDTEVSMTLYVRCPANTPFRSSSIAKLKLVYWFITRALRSRLEARMMPYIRRQTTSS
jgi:hypothetical protein